MTGFDDEKADANGEINTVCCVYEQMLLAGIIRGFNFNAFATVGCEY